jgi:acylphosphatase
MSAKHVIVHGQVQGVSFRANAEQRATELALAGWVRNRDDGGVEMHIEGDVAAVERMLEWAQEGPAHASVETVEARDVAAGGRVGLRAGLSPGRKPDSGDEARGHPSTGLRGQRGRVRRHAPSPPTRFSTSGRQAGGG